MKKITFYTELAYPLALMLLAIGTALMTYGGFGISMVVAPAYVLHLYISQFLPFFTFGMAEYFFQALIIAIMIIALRRVKLSYLLSFLTAVLYGCMLDGAMLLVSLLSDVLFLRICFYVLGEIICCASIALLFYSYFPPEAYELIIKELSSRLRAPIYKVKIVYDIVSLVLSVALSLIFFGKLRGIGIGSFICALISAFIIRLFQRTYEKLFRFKDKLELRKYFEEKKDKND